MSDIPLALLQLWQIAIFLFGISYVWKGNVAFTLTLQMVVGILAANHFLISVDTLRGTWWNQFVQGNIVSIIALVMALLLFSTFFTKWRWLARYPTAILAGAGLGITARNILVTDVISQVVNSMKPMTADPLTNVNNVIFIVVLIFVLFYFIFGFELKGPWAAINKYSRWVIMLAFGIDAGYYFYYSSTYMMSQQWVQVTDYIRIFLANIV